MTRKPRGRRRHASGQGITAALNFFAEAGLLKRVKRSGWWVAGIRNPESVAEHSFRTAVIAFYLAQVEDADPYQTVCMALFNDIHESRINDLHKMGHYYIDFKKAEKRVFHDQIEALDQRVKSQLKRLRDDYDQQRSPESILARDADILECLLQAREYFDHGYEGAKHFFKKAPDYLHSRSARMLSKAIIPGRTFSAKSKPWSSSGWWQTVVKFER